MPWADAMLLATVDDVVNDGNALAMAQMPLKKSDLRPVFREISKCTVMVPCAPPP